MSTISDDKNRRPKGKVTKGKAPETKRYSNTVDELQDVLKGIPDRPGKSLMTFEELQAKIGAKPKKDRFFGLQKMSTRYKAIGNKLDAVKATLANATVAQLAAEGGRDAFELQLSQQLDEIVDAGRRYQKKHTGKKGQAVQALLDDVARFRKEIPPALDALTEKDALPEGLGVDQAMAAKRAGIKPGQLKGVSAKHCNFANCNDDTRDVPPKVLGRGAVNTVDLVKHRGVERVFKEEQQTDKSQAWAPNFMGINTQDDPRYGNRNIAGGLVGKLLGTSVMPESSFGISEGKIGLLMQKAPGQTAKQFIDDYGDASLTPKGQASLQRQLADLEVCDILTGQSDRHPGNYMIDVVGDTVTVTGIDNDFAFPDLDRALGDKSKIPFDFIAMNSIKNMPVLMDKATAERVKAINFDRDMAPGFAGLLSVNEVRDAKLRFEALKNHIAKLETDGCIVVDWEKWRGPPPKSLDAGSYLAETGSNLFNRDILT